MINEDTTVKINKIKHNINHDFALTFKQADIEKYKFIPVNKKNDFFFVAIPAGGDKAKITALVSKFVTVPVKFISLDEESFDELFKEYITMNFGSESLVAAVSKTKKKIGEILIDAGYLTEEHLIEALAESKRQSIPIGSVLVKMGYVTLEQLKKALSDQQGYSKMLPEDFIRENQLIPLSTDGRFLSIGMVNPNNKKAINEVVYLSGLRPKVYILTHMEFMNALQKYYNESTKETSAMVKRIEQEKLQFEVEESLFDQVDRELEDASGTVAKFANKIISDAIDMKASDIHIEPRLNNYIVRYRIDGVLKKVLDLPAKVESSIIARFKVLSRMNIAEHRRPQDGTFTIKYNNISYDFRINTLPVSGREKMVIRILAPAVSISAQDKVIRLVGGTEDDHYRIKKMTSAPNGIILAVGPTGSGKTTTLYSVLKSLNSDGLNITTLEDPVEIKIDGINQSQINPKAGITFASCMKSILRQDPDIILIGEIRDYETLETAIAAALTGHLVLSTLHTNSAAATITRLIQMGAKDYLVSSTLTGIIAQRLVRRLCPNCKEAYHPSLEEAQLVVSNKDDIEAFQKRTIYRPKGCFECGHEGYKGRLGVYEIMNITKEIKKLIAQSAHDIEIEEVAVGAGMRTLQQSCLNHILNGETTIDEFVRVLGPVTE